jgi:hypothetical protein
MVIEVISVVAAIGSGAVAFVVVNRTKDAQIAELKAENKTLRQENKNKDDKIEVMLGEIADLKGELNFERGIYARPEADALQKQKIDHIEHEPNPLDDTTEKPKRGKR